MSWKCIMYFEENKESFVLILMQLFSLSRLIGTSSLALNGGGRIFHSPSSPLFSLLALLSRLFSSIERHSLHCSPNWKIMDLINWSLNAIDTIFSTRSLGFGEPDCPDGTFAAGYTMDAWERWWIVCLAALSVEDIEDIYLFGTMITGLLLIELGFSLGYRRIQKTGTAVQASHGCPSWLKQWEERSALRLRLLTAIWILSWRSSRLCKGKLMVLETRMDRESSRGIGMRLLAPRLNNRNRIFFGSPEPALASAKAAAGNRLAFLTHIHTYICTHLPTPDPSPPSLWTASLTSGSVAGAGNGCRTGWLLAGAGLLPLLQSRVSMVYYVLLLLRCFSCSHTVLPKEHSLGVIFFLVTFLMLCCIFLQFPVSLHFTSNYTLYNLLCDK